MTRSDEQEDEHARLVARAWEMSANESRGVRYIGEKLGVAPSTAARYVNEGRIAEQYIDLLDRAEARLRSATRLDAMTSWLADAYQNGGDAIKIVPVLLQIEARRAKLLGLDAPTQVQVNDQREPTPDPAIITAIREVTRAAEDDERALMAGAGQDEDDGTAA